MRIFVCGYGDTLLFEALSRSNTKFGMDVTLFPVTPDAATKVETLDLSNFDAVIQVGVGTRLFSKLTTEQSQHPGLILAPDSLDLAFRWRNCEKLTSLKREAAVAKLLLAASFEEQAFLEQLDSHPCRILPLNSQILDRDIVASRGISKDIKFCFLSASAADEEVYNGLFYDTPNGDQTTIFSRANVDFFTYDNKTLINSLVDTVVSSDCIIVAPHASQDSALLCLLAHSQRPTIVSETHASYRFLSGNGIFVERPDAYIEAVRRFASGTKAIVSTHIQGDVVSKCIDHAALATTLREFASNDRPLNSFLPHSSELRRSKEPPSQAIPYVVFHYPFAIEPTRTAARPMRLNAIRAELAKRFRLIEVYGPETVKKRRLRVIKDLLAEGEKIAFCYSETGTQPFSRLDETVFEQDFFRFLKRHNIPTLCYVRDAHWLDQSYAGSASSTAIANMKRRGHLDFVTLSQNVDVVATPSREFFDSYLRRKYPFKKHTALPPACDTWFPTRSSTDGILRLLYSGGLSKIYGLERFLDALISLKTSAVHLTVQSRSKEIEVFLQQYPRFNDRPEVDFVSGRMPDLVRQQPFDAGVLLLGPSKYLKTSVPKKLSDYASFGLPILSDTGCAYSSIVANHKIGLLVPSDKRGMQRSIEDLVSRREILIPLKQNCMKYATENTWAKRVSEIVQIMSDINHGDFSGHQDPTVFGGAVQRLLQFMTLERSSR